MKSKSPLLARLWRKVFPAKSAAPVKLQAEGSRPLPKASRSAERGIEPLEGRIAPAVLLPGGQDVRYTDADGDLVTIHFSKAIFTAPVVGTVDTVLANVFTFSTGKAHTGDPTMDFDAPQQLQTIDLTKLATIGSKTPATGVSFTITAEKTDSDNDTVLEGDGHANVGTIQATGIAIGSIVIPGDLGQIDAGNSTAPIAVQSLKVDSLGKLTTTQAGTANYESAILGQLGSFTADSIEGGFLHVTSSTSSGGVAVGKIGTVTIGHFIKARDVATEGTNDGRIQTAAGIGTLSIGSGVRDAMHLDTSDGLNGGGGTTSGAVTVGGDIGKLIVKGDLRGGAGTSSGSITAGGKIGSIVVEGALLGAAATDSGAIEATGAIGTVSIGTPNGPGLAGGAGAGSGVLSSSSDIGAITVSNILGSGANSGGISGHIIKSVTVTGSVTGGSGMHSGFIDTSLTLGPVKIIGNLTGGSGTGSGVVSSAGTITSFSAASIEGVGMNSGGLSASGKIASVMVTGLLKGGAGEHSGFIDTNFELGTVSIGNVEGGAGVRSGTILSAGKIASIDIAGHLEGGDATVTPASGSTPEIIAGGDLSGSITAGASGAGGIATLKIGAGLIGGTAIDSGVISSAGTIGNLTITNLASDGTFLNAITGGDGASSGVVYAFGTIIKATINGHIHGGDGDNSGSIQEHGQLGNIKVTGTLQGGIGADSGSIRALDSGSPGGAHVAGGMGTVSVGFIYGGDGLRSGVVSSDGAILSITTDGVFKGTNETSGRIVSGAGLYAAGNIGTLSIKNLGITGLTGGSVLAYGAVKTVKIQSIHDGAVHVADSIGGLFLGSDGDGVSLSGATITAGGQAKFNGKTDLAIGLISVLGDVVSSSILAGYGVLGDAENGHAQIGAVHVSGDWVSSNLVAGVRDDNGGGFGDTGDRLIPGNTSTVKARIASILIDGVLDAASGGHFGFVAQDIGSFKFGATKAALNTTAAQSFDYTGASGGTTSVREVTTVGVG